MSRATEELMDLLHGSVASELTAEIKKYKNGEMKDGDGNPLPIPSSLFAQAIKFLKDNKIDSPGRKNSAVDPLADLLAEEEDYEGKVVQLHPS